MMANVGDVGTLKELAVQVGDVIRIHNGFGGFENYAVKHSQRDFFVNDHGGADSKDGEYNFSHNCDHVFSLISRASDTHKLWIDMTPEEKGALLLAYHDGKVIEYFCHGFGLVSDRPNFLDWCAYRIKPEPKVEVVTLYGFSNYNGHYYDTTKDHGDTHKITFTTRDGKPDCESIKMEEV